MKNLFLLPLVLIPLLSLVSCGEKKDYYFTPTLDVIVNGGTTGGSNSPIQSSGSNYTPYRGDNYWGEDGREANQHYTPYNERSHNYNYYRGNGDD